MFEAESSTRRQYYIIWELGVGIVTTAMRIYRKFLEKKHVHPTWNDTVESGRMNDSSKLQYSEHSGQRPRQEVDISRTVVRRNSQ
jgi:hypothetical protein